MTLVRITAPHFCAGMTRERFGARWRCAPILQYMADWQLSRIAAYCKIKHWKFEVFLE